MLLHIIDAFGNNVLLSFLIKKLWGLRNENRSLFIVLLKHWGFGWVEIFDGRIDYRMR